MVITTAQLRSSKPELRFYLRRGSNPARGVSEIRDGEDLWQWSQLEIRLRLSSVNHTTKAIHHHHYHSKTVASGFKSVFFWRIKSFLPHYESTRKTLYNWKLLKWISRHPIQELFSCFSRYNLFNKHNFELSTKETGSYATPPDTLFKGFLKN